jgi:hypothetical protein
LTIIGAVDVGGTKIAAGAVAEDGTIIGFTECATLPERGFALAMRRTKAMLHEVASSAGVHFDGIGVACPGPLDPFTGVLEDVGTLSGSRSSMLPGLRAIAGLTDAGKVSPAVRASRPGSRSKIRSTFHERVRR